MQLSPTGNQQIYVLDETTREYFDGKKSKHRKGKRRITRPKKKQDSATESTVNE